MTAFNSDVTDEGPLDWIILRDGGIFLYWRLEMLADDLSWLEQNGYQIVSFNTGDWRSEDDMHESLQEALAFPDYYGRNLDALDECVWDDMVVPDAGGLVIVFRGYDRFANVLGKRATDQESRAEIVLDIFARAIRYHMLYGRRLMILVQSGDPNIRFGRVGGAAPRWNQREWFKKDRGV